MIFPSESVLPLNINSSFSLYISITVLGNVFDSEKSVFVNSNLPVLIIFNIAFEYTITGVY